ncbi:MAG: HNH endonuclease domain-containing protein [Bacteroidales bacterium]|nr:HNH endonuclease domain-containing protein [Bacteroidales bacterium]MDD4150417.1 HNH endonuclease domain-containing protein [Bacteroidales bacterium]
MTRILGLDLGTNSIGWAVVDKEEEKIIDAGVRIFPEGVELKTIGTGDKEQSRNSTRRDKRQLRRQFYRKRLRKIKLLELLIEQQMCPLNMAELSTWKYWNPEKKTDGRTFPISDDFLNWIRLNPYELRAKALCEEVSLIELGRILYHFIQRRGFFSSRKGEQDPKTLFEKGKPEENILPVNVTKNKIKDTSLGYYLNEISYKDKQPYRTIKDDNVAIRVRGRYTVREMYVEEFEKIWQQQAQFHQLENIIVKVKKNREIKGSLTNHRNSSRINYLRSKYGKDNVEINVVNKKTIVSTYSLLSLKEVLAGEISYCDDGEGQKRIKFKSNESILFWQRPLKSQKMLLANCRFENELPVINKNGEFTKDESGKIILRSKKPCPLSHPEFEEYRAWQFVNNIRFGRNNALSIEQKNLVLALINKNEQSFLFGKIRKELKLSYEKFNYDDDFKVVGNSTIKQLSPLFDKIIWENHFEDIWHCFYFYDDTDKLFEKLVKDFAYSKDIDIIKKVKLKDGYSNVSLKAIRNILPFLKKGYLYDRAVILGGVKNAFGKRWDYFNDFYNQIEREIISVLSEDNKVGEAIEKIKEHLSSTVYNYGFRREDPWFAHLYHHSQEVVQAEILLNKLPVPENLRNPIVQQGVNEMRRLVNSLIEKYQEEFGDDFRFDAIKVEMGRDLRNSKTTRQELKYRIKENEDKNEEAKSRLIEYGLQPSRNNIQKYLMWREIEDKSGVARCPYTGKTISISDLLGASNIVQIEHIIPYSVSLDDSFGNKTICESHFNNLKGELTPFQFYEKNPDKNLWGVDTWDSVVERVYQLLPYNKAKRFVSKRELDKSDFIARQLNDSRYIAKKSVELLSNICNNVRVMPGQLTAELRHLWGINGILQDTMENIDITLLENFDVENSQCYLILDEQNNIIDIVKKQNARPETNINEILLPVTVTENKLVSDYFSADVDVSNLSEGKYWAKLNIHSDFIIIPKYISKPILNDDRIVFRGKIEKEVFKNDTSGNIFKTGCNDGTYWADISIKERKFIDVDTNKERPQTKNKSQIVLFGTVINEEFKCYIYNCKTNLPNGKYWLIIELDFSDVNFVKAINDKPNLFFNQICLNATVNDEKILVLDEDKYSNYNVDAVAGKYYAVINVKEYNSELTKIENDIPKIEKKQKAIEGTIWVDKYTGEIKFDPKKNRDDHRHHAIDAIVIALTEQGYLQRLSTYNAQLKDKIRGKLDSTENFPLPWKGFDIDVKNSIDCILVSHKKQNKTLSKNRKGYCVRGQLHKENVFGKRQAPNQVEGFHRRDKITELQNNKHIAKVVDDTIRKLILEHLRDNCNVNILDPKGFNVPKDAFYKNGEWQLFLPNKRGDKVPIKKVRIKEMIGNAAQLKSNINQYVNPRNNHHVMIYKDFEDNLKEDVVQFWTVIERKLKGQDVYQLPIDGKEIVTILEINDMFLLGLSNEEYEDNKNNKAFLSKYLYKVQKLAGGSYFFELCFRRHIDSREDKYAKYDYKFIKNFGDGSTGWYNFNPIKVNTSNICVIEN